jgi:hypothetical protein
MKKFRNILVTFIVLVLFGSCTNWLNLAPEDGVIRENFWKTKEEVKSAVTGCYASLLNGSVQQMFLWGELRADMVDNGFGPLNDYTQVMDGEISATNSVVNWSSLYTVINNCNMVLKFAPTVQGQDGTFTEKQLKEYEAEALTLRALMYFYLVRSFRDVPLVLTASVTDDQNYSIPKTDGTQILDTLVRDLKIASANAPETYSSIAQNKSRITSWTAKTLLADIYLWQEKYAECNALCDEVIASGQFTLFPVSKSLINISTDDGIVLDSVYVPNESDADRMFAAAYVDGNSVESVFEIPFTIQKTNPFYAMLGAANNRLIPKTDNVDGVIFPLPQYESVSNATDIRGSGCSFNLGYIWKYVGASRSGLVVRASSQYTSPWLVYKYSDILLMKAEALNQLGLQSQGDPKALYKEAIANLQLVRSARNAVPTSGYIFTDPVDGKSLESSILDERAREFAFEGKRWFDVLRNAKRDNYAGNNINYLINLAIRSASPERQQSLISKYKDPKHNSHYWPIFNTELEVNKALKQNEFYAQ